MDKIQKAGLTELLKDSVAFNAAMSPYCTLRTGGNAEAICFIYDLSVLTRLICFLDSEGLPWMAVGKGSNLIVTDKGVEGAVIILKGKLAEEINRDSSYRMTAGGGISIGKLLKYCVEQELSGMEFMAGIPGTLGGAVIMNAGAYGEEIGGRIEKVRMVFPGGKTEELDHRQINFGYRKTSIPQKSVVYSVTLRIEEGKRELIRERIENNINRRKESQPLDMPSCGSVFKNPPGKYAAKLIEESELKGKIIGGAMVSMKHANFIVNTGNATAGDIIELIAVIIKKVREDSGIVLETEVRVAGQ